MGAKVKLTICDIAPNDWSVRSIEDICTRVTSGGTPSRKVPDFYKSGNILWVKTKELNDGMIYNTEERITKDATLKSSAKVLPINTVLLAMYGATVGQLGILGKEAACNQACCAMIVDENEADYRYLYYQLLAHKELIKSFATGAAQQNLSGILIKSLTLPFPQVDEQKDIADVLWCLDRKIELNQRMNETLEAMARALFKSWFVDFDPVRSKAEGRIPEGMDAATAVLFPAAFNDDGLPKGWSLQRVSDVLELSYGKALKKEERVAGNVPVYGSGGVTGLHNEALVEGPGIIVGRKGTVGSLYWEQRGFYPIDTVFYVVPNKGYSLEYAYYLLQTLGLETMNTDAAVPGLNRNNAYRLNVAKTSPEIIDVFTKKISVWRNLIDGNAHESSTLADIRDALLPKLISGELRIDDAKGKRGK